MPQDYYMVLTAQGAAKKANKEALGQNLQLTQFALSDGNGAYVAPDTTWDNASWVASNEVFRANLNQIYQDPNNITYLVCEGIVPQDQGGFYVRLVGIFDVDGDLIMVGAYPQTYKPTLVEGAARDLYIRAITEIGSASSVELKIDPSIVLATRKYTDDVAGKHVTTVTADSTLTLDNSGLILVDATTGNITITMPAAATMPALRYRFDRIDTSGNAVTIAAAATETINGVASLALAIDDRVGMMSDGTDDWAIVADNRHATETSRGTTEVATQAEVDAGTDDVRHVTPKKLRWGVSYSIGQNGYVALPSWLGGVVFQWGTATVAPETSAVVTLPITFPSNFFTVIATLDGTLPIGSATASAYANPTSKSTLTLANDQYASSPSSLVHWFGVGN